MISHSRNEKDTWIGTNVKRKRLQSKDKEYIRHRDLNSQPTNAMTDDFLTLIVSIFNFLILLSYTIPHPQIPLPPLSHFLSLPSPPHLFPPSEKKVSPGLSSMHGLIML